MNWDPILLTFKLALVTTFVLILIGIPIAFLLSESKSKFKPVIEAIISMPLVLPPTVIGFYFLIAFSPNQFFGNWLEETLGLHLVFSFPGLVIASIIYSLPFMVHPLQAGFVSLPHSLKEASYILGKGRIETLFKVLIPNVKSPILTGIVLSFAHTVGEFGVVLMIGGNIPGKTRVASIAIYDEVEALNYTAANQYSMVLFIVTFVILLSMYLFNRGYINRVLK